MIGGYYLIGIVAFIVSMGVSAYLRSTYGRWAKVANTAGLTGYEVARAILDANGLQNVQVEAVRGQLTDHYDPTKKVVRLSEDNYRRASVAGLAVAAHEVGHAIQHAKGYAPLNFRSVLARPATIGSQFGMYAAIFGLMLGMSGLVQIGILLFSAVVLFQLVTLPVEFDASRRALVQVNKLGLTTPQDQGGARNVLTAAAFTYVAAAATSAAYLLYFLAASRD